MFVEKHFDALEIGVKKKLQTNQKTCCTSSDIKSNRQSRSSDLCSFVIVVNLVDLERICSVVNKRKNKKYEFNYCCNNFHID